jgi:HAMP domain-containing protein
VLTARWRLRARRTTPTEPGTYRLASSIQLPWSIGLATLLILAVAIAVLVGRTGESTLRVPQVVLDYQEQITRDAAQSVRRSLNEGVGDLDELAQVLAALGSTRSSELDGPLREFARAHGRYRSVIGIDSRGRIVAQAGPAPPRSALTSPPIHLERPAVREVPRASGKAPLIEQMAPVTAAGSPIRALVAYYDPGFMRFPLEVSKPGNAWVVNARGLAVGARVSARPRLGSLPRRRLRQAARRAISNLSGAHSVGGSLDTQEVVGYAPVSGTGPAGRLGWGVVATRDVAGFSLPQTETRRQALMAGVVLGVLAVLLFGWLYVVLVSPLLRLQREAERLSHGDLSRNVEVVRYDEIGLVARSLERLRIRLIRDRVRTEARSAGDRAVHAARSASGNGKRRQRTATGMRNGPGAG